MLKVMINKKVYEVENYSDVISLLKSGNHSKARDSKEYMKHVKRRYKIKTGNKLIFCDEASFVEELNRVGEIEILN